MPRSQNLIVAFCKCGMVKLIGRNWTHAKNKKALPVNLPEEECPSCTLDIINKTNEPIIVI